MKFTTLLQETYKNDNGNEISADKVEYLAPYKHVIDGFYEWECGACGKKHSSRSCGWPISGQVLQCESCRKMNLLVRTNTDELSAMFGKNIRLEELDRQIKDKEAKLDQYVLKTSLKALGEAYTKYHRAQQDWDNALSAVKHLT